MAKIKSIILDVDGVLVGDKPGVNMPDPRPEVISKLKKIQKQGINIHLCSGKAVFAAEDLIQKAQLDSLHILESGALLINPIQGEIAEKNLIENPIYSRIIKKCLKENIYIEFYAINNYFVFKNQINDFTEKHSQINNKKPIILEDFKNFKEDVVKILAIAYNRKEEEIKKIVEEFGEKLNLDWAYHPYTGQSKMGLITNKLASKKQGLLNLAKQANIDLENTLAAGDGYMDWQFIKLCGYKATLENAGDELKKLILDNGGYIGPSVNENGILEALDYFLETKNHL